MVKSGRPKSEGTPYPIKPYLTIEQSNWLDRQPNKSRSIANLIQYQINMRPMTLINYKIDGDRTVAAKSGLDIIRHLIISVGVETATIVDRSVTAPKPEYAAPCSVGADGIYYRGGIVLDPTSYSQVIKFTVDRVSSCLPTMGQKSTTIHSFKIETQCKSDLIQL